MAISSESVRANRKLQALGDLVLVACVIAGASLLFIGASDLPPPRFEPLGSAAMPRILGTVLILLALPVAVQALINLTSKDEAAGPGSAPIRLPYRGVIVFVLLITYVAALDFVRIPFVVATTLFVMGAGMAMHEVSVRSALVHAALGLILSLSLDYIFSTYLFVRIG